MLNSRSAKNKSILFAVTEDWYFYSHRFPLAKQLRAASWHVSLASRFNEYRESLEEVGIRCLNMPFERSLRFPWRDLRACWRLDRAIRETRPDIVHLVSLKPILLSLLAIKRNPSSRFVAAFTGMGYLFSSGDRRAKLGRAIVAVLLRRILRANNVWALVQNDDDRELLDELHLGAPDRTHLIPGVGVDTKAFPFAELNETSAPIIVLPARIIRDKGITEFVAAAALVKRKMPGARFVLVGADDNDNPAALGASAIKAWVAKGLVEWWGHRRDMASVYHQASLVCLPSYREGLPKALLEGASCGRPLLASNVAGCRDVCIDNYNGRLVAARCTDALATAIIELLRQPLLLAHFGRNGRELVESRFSLEAIAAQSDRLYTEILSAPSAVAASA